MKLEDLFTLHNGIATSNLDISDVQDEFYNIPFLRPSSMALNSIVGYVSERDVEEKYIFEANSLYVSTNGQGSHTYSYVYPVRFSANSDIAVLMPKREMSLHEKLFYASIITANRYKYSYGRKPKGDRLMSLEVPSFQKNKVAKLETAIVNATSPLALNPAKIQKKDWKEFSILKVFNIKLGKPIHSTELEMSERGGIPYVTRTTFNNGIEFYAKEESKFEDYVNSGNVIIIGAEGFTAFYQKEAFINGNKINILSNPKLNKYNAMFLCTILNQVLTKKFNYGRGATKDRISSLYLKLPSLNNEPDFLLMEEYIKSLHLSSSI